MSRHECGGAPRQHLHYERLIAAAQKVAAPVVAVVHPCDRGALGR